MENKKIIVIISAIAAIFVIICNGISICNNFFGPIAKLRAKVQYSAIQFPPKFQDNIKELTDSLSNSEKSNLIKNRILSDLRFDGCWVVEIKNKGNKLCSGVNLFLPASKLFLVKRDNSKSIVSEDKNRVFVGDLNAKEEVMVYGWTHGYEGPKFKDKNLIHLSHANGDGRVILKLPLRDDWYYFSKLLFIIFPLTILLFIVFIIFLCKKNQKR